MLVDELGQAAMTGSASVARAGAMAQIPDGADFERLQSHDYFGFRDPQALAYHLVVEVVTSSVIGGTVHG